MVHAARLPGRIPGFIEITPFKAGRLDFNRIFGYATAIAVHAVLFLLLLVPITAPPAVAPPDVHVPWHLIEQKLDPPPPPPPVHAEVRPHAAHTAPTRTEQPPPPNDQQTVVNDDVVTNPVAAQPSDTGDTVAPMVGPVAGVQLEYAQAPAPSYPRDALRDAIEGTVMLRVLVDVDGRPLDVQIEHSSGNRSLDRAAREQVLQRWRFRPAMQNGRAVQAIGLVPVDFRLN
jgi:protein TonB